MSIIKKIFKHLFHKSVNYQERHREENRKIRECIINGGGTVGNNVDFYDVKMDMSNVFLYHIGNNVTLTNCRILNHDASMNKALGITKIGKIYIGDNVFVGANAILLPDIRIGNNVIVGAGAVVAKDIPDNSVVIGNPCRIISSFDEFCEKNKILSEKVVSVSGGKELTEEEKLITLENGVAFFG